MSIASPRITREFVLAGHAIFTVAEPGGIHHTYRVEKTEPTEKWPTPAWFVSFLSGPDNRKDYTRLAKLDDFTGEARVYSKTAKFKNSYKLRLLNRILARIWSGDHDAYERHGYRTHHEGMCGRCGAALTVPKSILDGFGPECVKLVGAARPKTDLDSKIAMLDRLEEKAEFARQEQQQEEAAYRAEMARDDAVMAGAY